MSESKTDQTKTKWDYEGRVVKHVEKLTAERDLARRLLRRALAIIAANPIDGPGHSEFMREADEASRDRP